MVSFPRQNNFDLIRLAAAVQVVLAHWFGHSKTHIPDWLDHLLKSFPGVPIFFILSGFLISASYQNRKSERQYFVNRGLRIFPALWVCFIASAISVAVVGGFNNELTLKGFLIWTATQLSFLQFYNPDFLRDYGVGVLNGSLWTIPVEMQFYLLTPLLYWILRRSPIIAQILFVCFIGLTFANSLGYIQAIHPELLSKLVSVSFLPWISMFIVGALLQINFERIRHLLEGKFFIWLVAYCLCVVVGYWFDLGMKGNKILFPWAVFLGGVACSAAFTNTQMSEKLLGHNDVSYGIYIYHMPIANLLIWLGFAHEVYSTALFLLLLVTTAAASWILIEKPALKLKTATLLAS